MTEGHSHMERKSTPVASETGCVVTNTVLLEMYKYNQIQVPLIRKINLKLTRRAISYW